LDNAKWDSIVESSGVGLRKCYLIENRNSAEFGRITDKVWELEFHIKVGFLIILLIDTVSDIAHTKRQKPMGLTQSCTRYKNSIQNI